MDSGFYKSTGFSLILGSILAIATMVLHPSGGSIEHIIKISKPIIQTHSLAIACLPFILFGFYGLTIKLLGRYKFSVLAFIIIAFGLFAAMLAALFNGLVVPNYLGKYSENIQENISVLDPILDFSFTINMALDYVFIVALCSAIAIYSIIIITSNSLSKWIGYFGIAILLFAIIGSVMNFEFTSLMGFRIFIFGIMAWILTCGVLLIKSNKVDP